MSEELFLASDVRENEIYGEACGEARTLCIFLAKYSSVLLGCGSTCIRLEKNVKRIAEAYGMEAELYIMPRHIQISVWEKSHTATVTVLEAVSPIGISFEVNTLLSRLSWEIADKKISFGEAIEIFEGIISCRKQKKFLIILLVALANASFCRLFGGDIAAMITVSISTAIGYLLKMILLKINIDVRMVVLLSALLSALIAGSAVEFSIGGTSRIALATSVLYLVPGIPFINSFSDVIYRHYICAFGRFFDAVVLTCCLSAGLFLAMRILGINMF